VADVSFAVERGEIFGLLGPNGAGKTTTIRIMLDIFRPDRGTVSILDGPMTEEKKNRIGYMPEERGLYQDVPLERCLVYLATLKGLSQAEAGRPLLSPAARSACNRIRSPGKTPGLLPCAWGARETAGPGTAKGGPPRQHHPTAATFLSHGNGDSGTSE